MVVAYTDSNDCNFAVKFENEADLHKVEEAVTAGIRAWYSATDDEIEGNEYFSSDEIEGFYAAGYAEPTMELLEKWGIAHEIVDVEYDENENVICDSLV